MKKKTCEFFAIAKCRQVLFAQKNKKNFEKMKKKIKIEKKFINRRR